MNRIEELFSTKNRNILSVYFTAGFPVLNSVEKIILLLENKGADMIEIGIPFSDPLADGPAIQESGRVALENGISVKNIFLQIRDIRKKTQIPLLLMSYLNPPLQYGFENFCRDAAINGIDGLIIPDLPEKEFMQEYKQYMDKYGLLNIFLITPDTSPERIRKIDKMSRGFIYMVSSASTTGKTNDISYGQAEYFKSIAGMNLMNPVLAGFGIYDGKTREKAASFVNGVIVGSAYIRALNQGLTIENSTNEFFCKIGG